MVARALNNAQLNSVAAYYDLVPGFEQLLKLNGGDLAKFYQAADKLAHEPKAERQRRLRSLGSGATGSTRLLALLVTTKSHRPRATQPPYSSP